VLDIISPCVTFNNHEGSTKSFDYVREHNEAINALDFVKERAPITTDYAPGTVQVVKLHDGSFIRLRKIGAGYDVHDRNAAFSYLMSSEAKGEIVTGLVYLDPDPEDMHSHIGTVTTPLNQLGDAELVPAQTALDKVNASLR